MVHKISWMAHLVLTLVAIPIVIKSKYIINSNALLTGCLKRTIDRAPIMPNESAIFPAIVFVITYVITGNIMKATVWACDFAQAWPVKERENLNERPPKTKINIDVNSFIKENSFLFIIHII